MGDVDVDREGSCPKIRARVTFRCSVDHVPLGVTESGEIVGSGRQPLSMSDEWGKEIVRKKEVRCSES